VTHEIATYSWPWDKTGDGKYTPMLFSVWPWILMTVIANAIRTWNWQWHKTNGQLVLEGDMMMQGMNTHLSTLFLVMISTSMTRWPNLLTINTLGLGMPFIDNDTCAKGGVIYLLGFFSSYDAIHGWMTGQVDGQMDWWTGHMKKLHEKWPRHPLLYSIAIVGNGALEVVIHMANSCKRWW
jgi:hypothetical protein